MTKYTKTELTKKTVAELETLLDEEGLEADDDWKKADYVSALLELEVDEDEEDDEIDDEIDDDEEVDSDEEDDEEDDIEVDEVEEKPAPKAKKSKKKESAEGTLAAKQVATILGTEAKTLRQFFRSPASTIEAVGSGGRYEFNEADVPKIKEEFEAWKAGHASRGASRGTGGGKRSRNKAVAEVEEIEEVEELDIEELDDEELDLEEGD